MQLASSPTLRSDVYFTRICDCARTLRIPPGIFDRADRTQYINLWVHAELNGALTTYEMALKIDELKTSAAARMASFFKLIRSQFPYGVIHLRLDNTSFLNQLSSSMDPIAIGANTIKNILKIYPCTCGSDATFTPLAIALKSNEWFTYNPISSIITLTTKVNTLTWPPHPWGTNGYGAACYVMNIGQIPTSPYFDLQRVALQFGELTAHLPPEQRLGALMALFGIGSV